MTDLRAILREYHVARADEAAQLRAVDSLRYLGVPCADPAFQVARDAYRLAVARAVAAHDALDHAAAQVVAEGE